MAVFWVTEALPIAVTSLLPVILFPMVGLMYAKDVSSTYINVCLYQIFKIVYPPTPKKKIKQNKQRTNKKISDRFDILNKDIHQHALIYDVLKSLEIHYNC